MVEKLPLFVGRQPCSVLINFGLLEFRWEELCAEEEIGRGRIGAVFTAKSRAARVKRRMHCLLAVSFTCVCLRLAFICWTGPNAIKCCPFQQIKANRKQTQVKLTASKQCVRRSAFYPCRKSWGSRHQEVVSAKRIREAFVSQRNQNP